jgi:hypothetical protein
MIASTTRFSSERVRTSTREAGASVNVTSSASSIDPPVANWASQFAFPELPLKLVMLRAGASGFLLKDVLPEQLRSRPRNPWRIRRATITAKTDIKFAGIGGVLGHGNARRPTRHIRALV